MKSACFNAIVLAIFTITSSFNSKSEGLQLVGVWESEEKNLQIEIFEVNGSFAGRMVYFKCATDELMRSRKDEENPDQELTNRNLLGLTLVTQLAYKGNNTWDNGKIYDPNSGNTFEARIHMAGPQSATVRGYWKYKWLGKSMVFHRLVK